MEIFVGTSGWMYSWNKKGNLDWYIENSNLNAVELNASFYRFPFENQIKGWSKKGENLRWSIKVHRLITHKFKLNEEAKISFRKFIELFKPMEEMIDFFLFQLPPSFGIDYKERILDFFSEFNKEKAVLEFRNKKWFDLDLEDFGNKNNLLISSIDSPDFQKAIFNVNGRIYLRFHGRESWYQYDYSDEELEEIIKIIEDKEPEKIYAFFNNNHSMLKNAQTFYELLKNV
ncbi:MAG: DUF72 domain-containing protein [Caldisericia bacterium]|nr:DUF72 domain-containing protein [Caldisericia bacterium]